MQDTLSEGAARAAQLPPSAADDAAPVRAARGGTADAFVARRECLVAQNAGWRANQMNRNIGANA